MRIRVVLLVGAMLLFATRQTVRGQEGKDDPFTLAPAAGTATWVVTSAEWASAGYGLDLKIGSPVYLYVGVGLVGTPQAKATANLSVGVARYDPLPGKNLHRPTITNRVSALGPTIPLSSDSLSAEYRFTFVWDGSVNQKTRVTAYIRLTDAKNSQVDHRTGGAYRSSGQQVTLSNAP